MTGRHHAFVPRTIFARLALLALTALAGFASAADSARPVRDVPLGREDEVETLENGDIVMRVRWSAIQGGRTHVLSAMDLGGCVELVVADPAKVPRYNPYLWDTETALAWSGRCRNGLRDGPGELTDVDIETGGTTSVARGTYVDGQRSGRWTLEIDGRTQALQYGTSRIAPKLAAEIAAWLPKLRKQVPSVVAERHDSARQSLAAAPSGARPGSTNGAGSASRTATDPRPATGSPAVACGSEIIVRRDDPRPEVGMAELSGYQLATEKPLGTLFTTTVAGAGKAGDIQWSDSEARPDPDIARILDAEQRQLEQEETRIATCSNACCGSARSYCALARDNRAKLVKWLRCVGTAAGLALPTVRVAKPAAPPPSYWGLAGPRVFVGYQRRSIERGGQSGKERLPLGAYVLAPVLVTGPSADAVLARLNTKYRTASGHLAYVRATEELDREYIGPPDLTFGALDKSCGAGHAAMLIDGSVRDAFPGHARLVTLGCGSGPEAAMQDALEDCQRQGACITSYAGMLVLNWEVVRWDGTRIGALAGAGGTADVGAAYSGIGGCGLEIIGDRVNAGPIGGGDVITAAMCRAVASRVR
jgi:hypothetical protein